MFGSPGVRLGGLAAGEDNLIANSGPPTSRQTPAVGGGRWEILGNRFVGNRGLAIDIGTVALPADGRQPNDAGEGDNGTFDRNQNFPEISARSFPAAGQVGLTHPAEPDR